MRSFPQFQYSPLLDAVQVFFLHKVFYLALHHNVDNPNHVFTGLIWYASNKGNFTHRPDRFYLNKQICVSGVITQYRGIPQIQIDFEEQIEIQ